MDAKTFVLLVQEYCDSIASPALDELFRNIDNMPFLDFMNEQNCLVGYMNRYDSRISWKGFMEFIHDRYGIEYVEDIYMFCQDADEILVYNALCDIRDDNFRLAPLDYSGTYFMDEYGRFWYFDGINYYQKDKEELPEHAIENINHTDYVWRVTLKRYNDKIELQEL